MAAPLIYRPTSNWNVWAAFVSAVFIHIGAVAVAERAEPVSIAVPNGPADIDIISIVEDPQPPEVVEPPPEIAPLPLPIPDSTFIEEQPTPPPVQQKRQMRAQRLVRSAPAAVRSSTAGSARALAISAPRPEYPHEARARRVTGSGVAKLTVDGGGRVVEVTMVRSTGSAVLDAATISGLRRWRFAPGTVSTVQTPVTYTLAGASY